MFPLSGIVCAVGILCREQEKGDVRSGTTDEPFDELAVQKTTALRVAVRRSPAVSPRSTVLPDTLFARLLADRIAATQRSWFNLGLTCSGRDQKGIACRARAGARMGADL